MRHATIALFAERAKATVEVELRMKQSVSPHLTVDLDLIGTYTELAICMRGYERVRGRWCETVGGQGQAFLLQHFKGPRLEELCELWGRWHLNGMQAGNREQNQALERAEKLAKPAVDHFTFAREHLAKLELNPSRGYKYGSAWLVEPLPPHVIEDIERVVAELGGRFVEISEVA